MRRPVPPDGRVVVKIGSSSLVGPDAGIDRTAIERIAGQVADLWEAGLPTVLVTSGAVAAGLAPLGLDARPTDVPSLQTAAAVGQGLLMHSYAEAFASRGRVAGQVLLTRDVLANRDQYLYARQTLDRMLTQGVVPVVNENDTIAIDGVRFGDNDRLAALVAHLVRADALILLSDVDALYTGDPRHGDARRITDVHGPDDLADVKLGGSGRVGTGGMVTKVEAARIAGGASVPVVLTNAASAAAALAGEPVGTYFHPTRAQRPSTRLLWLAHATTGQGRLILDPGAVDAVVRRRKSLLPAGVTGVEGDFSAGDPVDVVDGEGRVVARGLVNYDAGEIPALMGRSTRWLARELGPEYQREIIHRDDLVILDRRGDEGAR